MMTCGPVELVCAVSVCDCVTAVTVELDVVVVAVPAGGVDTDEVSADGSVAAAVFDEPDEVVSLSTVPESGVADDTPVGNATAIPTPNATANAPTRPMCCAHPIANPSVSAAGRCCRRLRVDSRGERS